MVVLIYSLQV